MKLTRPAYYLRKLAKQYNVSLSGLDLRKTVDVVTAKSWVVDAIIESEVRAAAKAENIRFFQEVQTLQNKYFRFQFSITDQFTKQLGVSLNGKTIAKISANGSIEVRSNYGLNRSFTSLEEAVEYAIDGYIESQQRTVKPVIETSTMTGTHNDVRLLLGSHYTTNLNENTITISERLTDAVVGKITYKTETLSFYYQMSIGGRLTPEKYTASLQTAVVAIKKTHEQEMKFAIGF
jgi:hypothetical protein